MFGPIKDLKKSAAKLNALVESAKRWWDFFAKKIQIGKSSIGLRNLSQPFLVIPPKVGTGMRINFGGFAALVAPKVLDITQVNMPMPWARGWCSGN